MVLHGDHGVYNKKTNKPVCLFYDQSSETLTFILFIYLAIIYSKDIKEIYVHII